MTNKQEEEIWIESPPVEQEVIVREEVVTKTVVHNDDD
jgi:hypothetical protein